jgi:hypothetical protein
MPHAVGAQVAPTRLLDKRQCPLSNLPQFRQHRLFFANRLDIRRNRRLPPDQPQFHNRHGNVQSLVKWYCPWPFLQDSVCISQDGPLDGDQVPNEFACGPAPFTRRDFPLVPKHAICRAQECLLRPIQILDYGVERSHRFYSARCSKLRRPSRPLARRRAPVAARVLPQRPGQRFASRPAGCRLACRRVPRSPERPLAIP